MLTHWGWVTHICVGNLTIVGSDNGLSIDRRQAIIWTNAGILLIWPSGTNFSEVFIVIHIFSFKKMHLKISSVKGRPFCLGLNVFLTKLIMETSWLWYIHCWHTGDVAVLHQSIDIWILCHFSVKEWYQSVELPAWISNHRPGKVWDGITYPFLNFNGLGIDK